MNNEPTLSVKLTAQNSNPRALEVSAYVLTAGQWAPNAEPTLGQIVAPATTGCWLAIATDVPGEIKGYVEFLVLQAGTLQVTWDFNPANPFAPVLDKNINNAPDLAATIVVNQGDYMHVWAQLIISVVTTVQPGETLADIASRFDTNEATLRLLNGFSNDTTLVAGEQVLVASPIPAGGPTDCSDA